MSDFFGGLAVTCNRDRLLDIEGFVYDVSRFLSGHPGEGATGPTHSESCRQGLYGRVFALSRNWRKNGSLRHSYLLISKDCDVLEDYRRRQKRLWR
jgi:hypothetical protein